MRTRTSLLALTTAMALALPAAAQNAPDSVQTGDDSAFTMTPLAKPVRDHAGPRRLALGDGTHGQTHHPRQYR
ncbi:MAG: hypothetical protein Q4G24_16530 [Paracoccus sp. (in: a-proteobacteria)]|uniref:hypothetical protein n=1 Tax=Paracoccus sp. TaxID=267 RepID=UPI0026DF2F6F|nr:hypothetical protein [Paracoccus sp. (in: a-proteobacteria)]MDO5623043.1 hypothetical protein [Paracoccus sp. (in: a-proteobacteria)]